VTRFVTFPDARGGDISVNPDRVSRVRGGRYTAAMKPDLAGRFYTVLVFSSAQGDYAEVLCEPAKVLRVLRGEDP
jgi:hypothetical protein